MALANYSDLKAAVANWLDRTDLTARVPEFITLAEAKLNRDLRARQMEQRSTANTVASEPFLTLPTDFQSVRRLRVLSAADDPIKPELKYLTPDQLNEYRVTRSPASASPTHFTIKGDQFELWPTPDAVYTLDMVYRKNIPALSDSSPTNWLLTYAPDVYLYGALLEAAPYLMDDERIGVWSAAFGAVISSVNRVGWASSFIASPLVATPQMSTP